MRVATSLFVVCSACADPSPNDPPVSLRDRLERGDASLAIVPAASAGAIAASHRVVGQWRSGLVDLKLRGGELALSLDRAGVLTLERLAIALDPIAIPDTVLGYDVQLTDVAIALAEPVRIATTAWNGDDESRGTAALELELAWSLTSHGSTSPLGAPRLPPIPISLEVSGTGSVVDAELRAQALGELWSWAGLVRLEDLSLIVAATTRAPP